MNLMSLGRSGFQLGFSAALLAMIFGPIVFGQTTDVLPLPPGKTIEREMSGNETHRYEFELKKNEFFKIHIEQKGSDFILELTAADGTALASVLTWYDNQGPHRLTYAAPKDGTYRLEIGRFVENAKKGVYTIRREPTRTATARERKLRDSKPEIFEEYITKLAEMGEFNGNVLVAEKGKVIYRKSIGQRSVKPGDTLDLGAQFGIGSINKTFTATAIMRLKDAGKLDFDDPVRKYIPEWPYKGATIRNLLTHTSGLPLYRDLLREHWKPWLKDDDPEKIIENGERIMQMIIDHKPQVEFQPGEQYGYLSVGYTLLEVIVERVSGIPYHRYMKEEVFLPAGMKDTFVFRRSRKAPLKNRVYGITRHPNGSGLRNAPLWFGPRGIYTTVEDLYSLDRILFTEKLVSASSLKEAFTLTVLNNGDNTRSGLGWGISPATSGAKYVETWGGGNGFGAFFVRRLDKENTVIALTNYPSAFLLRNLELILEGQEYKLPKRSIVKVIGPTVVTKGIEAAREQYFELKKNRSSDYDFGAGQLNQLGCGLIHNGYKEEGLLIYQFNSDLFPKAANVWHGLATCYYQMGDTRNALANLRKALKIDSGFGPSKGALTWLKKMNWDGYVPNGIWLAEMAVPGGRIPFRFKIGGTHEKPTAALLNGKREIPIGKVRRDLGRIHMLMPAFNASISVSSTEPETTGAGSEKPEIRLKGVVRLTGQGGKKESIMFTAVAESDKPMQNLAAPIADISGQWQTSFIDVGGGKWKAVGEFTQSGNTLAGTILTPKGEYRNLKGIISGRSFFLASFDGKRASLFKGIVNEEGNIEGKFWFGKEDHGSWAGVRDGKAPPDPVSATNRIMKTKVKQNEKS